MKLFFILVVWGSLAQAADVEGIRPREVKANLCKATYVAKLVEAGKKIGLSDADNIAYSSVPDNIDEDCFFVVKQKATYTVGQQICSSSGNGNIGLVTGSIIACLAEGFNMIGVDFFIRTNYTRPEGLWKDFNNSFLCSRKRKGPFPQPTSSSADNAMLLNVVLSRIRQLKLPQNEDDRQFFLCELPNPSQVQDTTHRPVHGKTTVTVVNEKTTTAADDKMIVPPAPTCKWKYVCSTDNDQNQTFYPMINKVIQVNIQ